MLKAQGPFESAAIARAYAEGVAWCNDSALDLEGVFFYDRKWYAVYLDTDYSEPDEALAKMVLEKGIRA